VGLQTEISVFTLAITKLLYPAPIGWGHYATMARRTVRLFVCPMPDPKSRTEEHRKLKLGRKETHVTGDPWPHLEFEKVKGQGYNAMSSVSRVFAHNWTKKSHRSTKIDRKVVRVKCDIAHQFQGRKVKDQGHQTDKWSGWLFKSPLAGGGEYCGGLPHSLLLVQYSSSGRLSVCLSVCLSFCLHWSYGHQI